MAVRRQKRRPGRQARAPRAPGRSFPVLLAVLAITAAGIATYANSFAGVFVFDDEPAIVENPHIRHLWPLTTAMAAPDGTTLAGRPIASLSFAINYALAPRDARDVLAPPAAAAPAGTLDRFHRNLRGYHAANLAIHLFAALTLFGIVRRTLLTGPLAGRFGGAEASLAFATALIWVVHPLQTAAVTYVVQRVESLMALFYLLTLYCAIRAHERDKRVWWMAGAVAACVLGMGTKEVMVTAPLVVMLWDVVFAPSASATWRSRLTSLWSQRWRLYVSLALTWVIMGALVAGDHRPHAAGFGFEEWPWWRYLLTQTAVVAHYLRLAFVPHPLVLDYAWPPAAAADVAPQLGLLGALLGLTVWALWRRHPSGFAGSCFFLILAPTSSVYPIVTEVAAEHRMYLPLAAVISLVVPGVYALAQRSADPVRGRTSRRAATIAVATVAIGLASQTVARNRDYHSYERIWADTIRKQPQNARARTNYATALMAAGRYRDAEEHLRVAVAVKPQQAEAHTALGAALCGQGRFDEGIEHLQQAIALEPAHPAAHQNLGEAHAARGESALAVRHFLDALDRRPDDIVLLNRAGWILATAASAEVRDGARALALAGHAADLTGRRDVITLDTLAAAYAESDRLSEAVAVAREALALAKATRDRAIVPELEHRLALYEAGRKFRQ